MHVMNEQNERRAVVMPTPEQVVARQVRLLRQGREWSQQEVADKMRAYGYEWSQATVTRLESASRPIRVNELVDLASLFRVPVTQFLEDWGPDFQRVDLATLESEIASLVAERNTVSGYISDAETAQAQAAIAGAQAVADLARIESRLEILMQWLPQVAERQAGPAEAGG
jgi:transcriptional regulator with XRE-family HTH domain